MIPSEDYPGSLPVDPVKVVPVSKREDASLDDVYKDKNLPQVSRFCDNFDERAKYASQSITVKQILLCDAHMCIEVVPKPRYLWQVVLSESDMGNGWRYVNLIMELMKSTKLPL